MRGLAEELAGIGVEYAFLRGRSVAAHQHSSRGMGMAHGDVPQPPVSGFARREENQRHVHHDVDEQRVVGDEGAQVLALFLEARRQSPAGFDQHVAQGGIVRHAIPAVVGGQKQQTQIVHVAILLARLQGRGVADGVLQPELRFRRVRLGMFVENPHHAGQEAVGPVRPGRPVVFPFPVGGVQRIELRMLVDQLADLLLRELKRMVKQFAGVA